VIEPARPRPDRTMHAHVGEDMPRQPSLPTLTTRN
jgi:hypothetical protein